MNRTDQIIKFVKGPSVLDLGCTGHVINQLSNDWLYGRLQHLFPDIVGVDISEENVNKLRSLGYKNLYVQNAETFQFEDNFDTIVAGELIEHLSNPGLFLSCAYEHLKPGGRLIITTPNPFCLFFFLYAFLKYPKTCPNDEHTFWFCPSTFRTLYKRYGFSELFFNYISDYFPDTPSWRYKLFIFLIKLTWIFFPKRIRENRMIFVLTKN